MIFLSFTYNSRELLRFFSALIEHLVVFSFQNKRARGKQNIIKCASQFIIFICSNNIFCTISSVEFSRRNYIITLFLWRGGVCNLPFGCGLIIELLIKILCWFSYILTCYVYQTIDSWSKQNADYLIIESLFKCQLHDNSNYYPRPCENQLLYGDQR